MPVQRPSSRPEATKSASRLRHRGLLQRQRRLRQLGPGCAEGQVRRLFRRSEVQLDALIAAARQGGEIDIMPVSLAVPAHHTQACGEAILALHFDLVAVVFRAPSGSRPAARIRRARGAIGSLADARLQGSFRTGRGARTRGSINGFEVALQPSGDCLQVPRAVARRVRCSSCRIPTSGEARGWGLPPGCRVLRAAT